MLSMVRKLPSVVSCIFAAAMCLPLPLHAARLSPARRPLTLQTAAQQAAPGQTQEPQGQAAPAQKPAPKPTMANPPLPIIVLDPAHGGTDTGARGTSGLAEKDVVLQIARTLEAQLITHGYHVVMTRSDDSNPSYDDRAATANAYRNAICITLHVGSSGKMGTVRAFYDQSWSADSGPFSSSEFAGPGAKPATPAANSSSQSLLTWQEAQRPYVDASHRLADTLQLEFAQMFPGSPASASAVPLRDLRSIANPAVAIEISSIGAPNADALLELSGSLSVAIEKAIEIFRHGSVPEVP